MAKKVKKKETRLVISAPNFKTATFTIIGETPLVMNKFSNKAQEEIKADQEAGSTKKKGIRKPKDFKACYEAAKHISEKGWSGIPASAFRSGMIRACSMVGFQMTKAKMSVFIEADGYDKHEGTPLVKITKGKPRQVEHMVRVAGDKCDIRARPMWNKGWEAVLRVRYDNDQFTLKDVANLLVRVGEQVGILEGRPFAHKSDGAGMGWGLFRIKSKK